MPGPWWNKQLAEGYAEVWADPEFGTESVISGAIEWTPRGGRWFWGAGQFGNVPIDLPDYPVDALVIILVAEAAAAFDELTRSGKDDLLVRQIKNAWPNVFRSSRLIPAVEYIQANRLRHTIIQDMEQLDVDLYVAPSFGGNNLLLTNLTGHPCVVLPNGFDDKGAPVSISFIGKLYDEATVLAVAKAYQDATEWHHKHPPLFQ